MLSFFVATDLHFYNAEVLGPTDAMDQVALNESGAIIDEAFALMAAQTDTEIVLVTGDLCVDGTRVHHEGMREKLRRLQERGKRVCIITSLHDFDRSWEEERRPGVLYRDELRGFYGGFGFNEAIASFEELSYVVQLAPGLRLLGLNDDGDSRTFYGYTGAQLTWILEQIGQAKEDGQEILAMTHHAVIPPTPVYPVIAPQEMLHGHETVSALLADAGLRFIFVGHTHMQDIRSICTTNGNTMCQINTGALTGIGAPFRKVTIDGGTLRVETQHVENADCDLRGETLHEFLRGIFDRMLRDIFYGAAHDIDLLAANAVNFSMDSAVIYKYRVPIQLAGKFFYRLTAGQAGWLCLCPRKVDKSIRQVRLRDLTMEIVRNLYAGSGPYGPDTPMGKAILAVMGRIGFFVNPLLKKMGIRNLRDFVASIIYDPTPDDEAVFPVPAHACHIAGAALASSETDLNTIA